MSAYRVTVLAAVVSCLTLPTVPAAAQLPDRFHRLGPDSEVDDEIPSGTIHGPHTLPCEVFSGTQHTYWVYVPAQYDGTRDASLMVFQDGHAFLAERGNIRAPIVLDNLIHRREIPVMLAVFINPGRRPDQPEPGAINWGDSNTNRPEEYNSLDDRYARVIIDELLPRLQQDYRISPNPEHRGIGGASSGAIAAFTVAWQRPDQFRKVLSMIGSYTNIRGGHVYPELVRDTARKPIRVFFQDGRNDNRGQRNGTYDATWDWYLQNVRLAKAMTEKGYDINYVWGIGKHNTRHGGAIMPEMMRWLWRDYGTSTDPTDATERSLNRPADFQNQ